MSEFEEKARHKHIKPEDLEERINQLKPVFKKQWADSMQRQIKFLPPFETVSRELNRHLRKIFKG
jgi:hypothetical protein